MDYEQRKSEIRRRLIVAQNPRRANAQFNADNDHIPIVLQDCPRCYGTGKTCERSGVYMITRIKCRLVAVTESPARLKHILPMMHRQWALPQTNTGG